MIDATIARRANADVVDIAVVGAGFAGMYMVHKARTLGLSVVAFEAGGDVGGTWYWNRYPGARCDVPSVEYSYQFDDALQQEWEWTERYAGQPEILRYAQHVADRFDLKQHIRFNTKVVGAAFTEGTGRWTVSTDDGDSYDAQFVVMATGNLSSTNVPALPGASSFAGRTFHTGSWPHEPVSFVGRRVGVIGTGSSALQAIPQIAEVASHLTVFQRTATFSAPAHNGPIDHEYVAEVKANYPDFRARNKRTQNAFGADNPRAAGRATAATDDERERILNERWELGGLMFLGAFNDVLRDRDANQLVAEFVHRKIDEIVHDPVVAAKLKPKQLIGCKRLCADTDYYQTFNRPNVTLVDLGDEPIEELTPSGVVAGGISHELDDLVYATGFDAMTGSLLRLDIRGSHGITLREAWHDGPVNYLGISVHGFPNLFTIMGPGSPSVLANMITGAEHHVEFIGDLISAMRAAGERVVEASADAQDAWVDHVNAVAAATLYPACNSWYLGANVPGKKRVFMPLPGFPAYIDRCAEIVANGYAGFTRV
jgi:cation diffusion facilitator CzcD-associated flavoprotein CzcO